MIDFRDISYYLTYKIDDEVEEYVSNSIRQIENKEINYDAKFSNYCFDELPVNANEIYPSSGHLMFKCQVH